MSKFPKVKTITTEETAKSVEEALEAGRAKFKPEYNELKYDVVQEPSRGFLGLGAKDAVVRFTIEVPADEPDTETVTQTAAVQTATSGTAPAAESAADTAAAAAAAEYDISNPEEAAKEFLSNIVKAMDLDINITAKLEDNELHIELAGEKMGIIIGKRGDTLNSLQYLTSLVINRGKADYIRVVIDTEHYRDKREAALVELSDKLAARVAATGKKFALEPMNPYERRVIHANLQNNEGVTTFSVGQEPYRKVIIAPKRRRPRKRKKQYGEGGKPSYERRSYDRNSYDKPSYGRRSYDNKPAYDNNRGGYGRRQSYHHDDNNGAETKSQYTYKADFKPQQHKAEYKNFDEYLAAHSEDND